MWKRLQRSLSTLRSVARFYGLTPAERRAANARPLRAIPSNGRRPEAVGSAPAGERGLDRSVESISRYIRDAQRQRSLPPPDSRADIDRRLRDRSLATLGRPRDEEAARERELLAGHAPRGREDPHALGHDDGAHLGADPHLEEEKVVVGDIYERVDAQGRTHTHVMLATPSRSGKAQRTLEAIAATGTVDRDQANAYAGDLHRSEMRLRHYDPARLHHRASARTANGRAPAADRRIRHPRGAWRDGVAFMDPRRPDRINRVPAEMAVRLQSKDARCPPTPPKDPYCRS